MKTFLNFVVVTLLVVNLNRLAADLVGGIDSMSPRIVGGMPAEKNEYPYVLSLYVGNSFCGAVIISDSVALTAAHCFDDYKDPTLDIFVMAGDHIRSDKDRTKQRVSVAKFITHEDYKIKEPQHDIALLKLKSKIRLNNKTAKAVPLPDAAYTAKGIASLCGWGTTKALDQQPSDILMKAKVSILSDEECEKYWGGKFFANSMLCAKGAEGVGSCRGDSGSPLVDSNGLLVGLVSGGHGCGQLPGLYTEVAKYNSWIKRHMV